MRTIDLLSGLLLIIGGLVADKPAYAISEMNPDPRAVTSTDTGKADQATARGFENAIANRLFQDIAGEYASLEEAERVGYLARKLEQLERSVNFAWVNAATRRQRELLAWLLASEEARLLEEKRLQKSPEDAHHYLYQLNRLTSLNWSLTDYANTATQEAERINWAITQQWQDKGGIEAGMAAGMKETRQTTEYPADTFQGRQDYLDRLAGGMMAAQSRWADALNVYPYSPIDFEGFEASPEAGIFVYEKASGTLRINLSDVTHLPLFELPAVAIYYGFPGLHSLHSAGDASLQQLLQLPGYTLGWAAYIAELLGTGGEAPAPDPEAVLQHLYFQRLLTGLALVDLRLHTEAGGAEVVQEEPGRKWTDDEALAYLLQTTPYTASRLAILVREVRAKPGYYLAALAGKVTFAGLQGACLNKPLECELAGLHTTILNIGPIPFPVLRKTLGL